LVVIVLVVCVSNGVIALCCSALARKTSVALLGTYTIILGLYALPIAAMAMLSLLQPEILVRQPWIQWSTVTSPFAALFALPLDANLNVSEDEPVNVGNLKLVFAYFAFTLLTVGGLLGLTIHRLKDRSALVGD
jgi:hypothetical protein